jgi:hypothetical protein
LKNCDSQRFLAENLGFVNSKQKGGREKEEIGDFGISRRWWNEKGSRNAETYGALQGSLE